MPRSIGLENSEGSLLLLKNMGSAGGGYSLVKQLNLKMKFLFLQL